MFDFINIATNFIANKNVSKDDDASLNLLDIGCSSFIPDHFVKFAKIINYVGCDPDYVGIKKLKEQSYIKHFKSILFLNVAASIENKESFLMISKKRTGSKIIKVVSNKNQDDIKKITLVKTSNLQKKFNSGYANLIKIDAEGHELEVIKGINLECDNLLGVEVECTLSNNNNLSSIITAFEKNNFFLASMRYHNSQTFNVANIENFILRIIYKVLIRIPIINKFNNIWTNLSGEISFSENKSFLNQIELIFLKQRSKINKINLNKYNNVLVIYGFLRYLSELKGSKINKFIINNFPSR